MGAFDNFLRKHGYAKLDRYGLVLTEDDRVLSTRSAVLDDGLGGKIVGWVDGDLAAAELQPFGAPQAAAPKRAPTPPPMPRPSAVTAVAAPAPVAMPAPVAAPVAKPPAVAASAPEGEDEWEWEIAMARARAAAEDVQTAAASVATSFTAPSPRKAGAMPVPTQFAKGSAPHAVPPVDPMTSWPGTDPLGAAFSDVTREAPTTVMSPAAKTLAVARTEARRTPAQGTAKTAPRTAIPIPSMPVAVRPTDIRPVMASRTRIARGTLSQREPANSDGDTTVIGKPEFPDDHTVPYMTMPSEVKPTGYAHTKRVAAKHR